MPLPRLLLSALLSLIAAASGLLTRLQVQGPSMIPTLGPGDRVLVLRLPAALMRRCIRADHIVACRDPRDGQTLLTQTMPMIKRVHEVSADGTYDVRGDNSAASTDSRTFGPLSAELIIGRVIHVYHRAAHVGSGNLH